MIVMGTGRMMRGSSRESFSDCLLTICDWFSLLPDLVRTDSNFDPNVVFTSRYERGLGSLFLLLFSWINEANSSWSLMALSRR